MNKEKFLKLVIFLLSADCIFTSVIISLTSTIIGLDKDDLVILLSIGIPISIVLFILSMYNTIGFVLSVSVAIVYYKEMGIWYIIWSFLIPYFGLVWKRYNQTIVEIKNTELNEDV